MHWRLNRLQYPIYNLGPGKRIGIWTQGCSLHCPGCVSQSLWSHDGGKVFEAEHIAQVIIKVQHHFDGVTITGGEPFEQYKPLLVFCSIINSYTDLTIFVFSGYYLEELQERYPDQLFMSYLDYLLDGRYEQGLHENCNARGSSNQHLYHFENGKPMLQEELFYGHRWSFAISDEGKVFLSGIPKKHDLAEIIDQFSQAGLTIKFQ
jgi:anaerobic ribonucleoside-triphosphate reductase activating protein